MLSTGQYSIDLMTRVLSGLGPLAIHYGQFHEVSVPCLEEICGNPPPSAQPSPCLSDVINTFDQQPVGWFPPLHPVLHPHLIRRSPPAPLASASPADCLAHPPAPRTPTPDPPDYPGIRRDWADPTSPVSTSSGEPSTRSPSLVPTREPSVGPVRRAKGRHHSPESSPIAFLREKERKRIRGVSGVKPKAKAPRRSVGAAPGSHPPSEMVRCKWGDCAERFHVDYVSVEHWGRHLREHFADQRGNVIRCKWGGGCSTLVQRSSMWKHIVVHQPKFKIRCPRGCDVSTRADMMRRHLRYCPYAHGHAAGGWESEEADMEVGEDIHVSDDDGDGGGVEEGGKEE